MNLVFLDVDGVLNNLGSVLGLGSPSKFFDPVSVALVKRLCTEGRASIVVSSSWRTGNLVELCGSLKRCGAGELLPHIIGETPELRSCIRGEEIARFLRSPVIQPVQRYVILDDDSDMLPDQPFVKTTFEDGFRFKHYIAALRHLVPEHADCRDRALIVPVSSEHT